MPGRLGERSLTSCMTGWLVRSSN